MTYERLLEEDPRNKLFAIGFVCMALGVSADTVRRKLDKDGELPSVRTNSGQRRWKYLDVLNYYKKIHGMEQNEQA